MKQQVWYMPKDDSLWIVESRGREYVVAYYDEENFMDEDSAFGVIVDRKELSEKLVKIGTL